MLIDSSLFAQYVQYKAALSELTLPQASGGLSTQEWWQLHQSLLDLQARYFSAEQQALSMIPVRRLNSSFRTIIKRGPLY
ncbi:lipase chaperone [Vibrio cholerae]|nr:lipase chaperone [Vibrio cholerae]